MGREWYESGKVLKKRNTFTDFIACAKYLIQSNYTTSEKLAITGRSAGGLLMGAVTNMENTLFKTVVSHVPFVDVMTTMLDETIPLTVIEWEEWGDPRKPDHYRYMKSYSPYDHVEHKEYGNILVTTAMNDPRVGYWEPLKWVARLRASRKENGNILALKINTDTGHMGEAGRYKHLKELAFEYAFILYTVLGKEAVS